MPKKKSFNPFKMWGSYVGVLVAYVAYIFLLMRIGAQFAFGAEVNYTSSQIASLVAATFTNPLLIISTLFAVVVGFVIGWGIHSLFRAFRRR